MRSYVYARMCSCSYVQGVRVHGLGLWITREQKIIRVPLAKQKVTGAATPKFVYAYAQLFLWELRALKIPEQIHMRYTCTRHEHGCKDSHTCTKTTHLRCASVHTPSASTFEQTCKCTYEWWVSRARIFTIDHTRIITCQSVYNVIIWCADLRSKHELSVWSRTDHIRPRLPVYDRLRSIFNRVSYMFVYDHKRFCEYYNNYVPYTVCALYSHAYSLLHAWI